MFTKGDDDDDDDDDDDGDGDGDDDDDDDDVFTVSYKLSWFPTLGVIWAARLLGRPRPGASGRRRRRWRARPERAHAVTIWAARLALDSQGRSAGDCVDVPSRVHPVVGGTASSCEWPCKSFGV